MVDELSNNPLQQSNPFIVENLFRKVFPYLTEQGKEILRNWQNQRVAFEGVWGIFVLDKTKKMLTGLMKG